MEAESQSLGPNIVAKLPPRGGPKVGNQVDI